MRFVEISLKNLFNQVKTKLIVLIDNRPIRELIINKAFFKSLVISEVKMDRVQSKNSIYQ